MSLLKDKIQITHINISDLIPSEYNPRQATDKECQDLKKSIQGYGIVDPIIVNSASNRKNIVIGGHFRLRIAKDLGYQNVPVVYLDIPDEAKERDLNLRLNKNLGDWDLDMLANFDEEILLDVGFSAAELDNIFDLQEGKTNPNVIPARPKESKTKTRDVARLMNGQQADMVFTDPPYNVNYKGTGKDTSEGIENDNLPVEEFDIFIAQAFERMYSIMREGAVFYICSGWSSYPVFYDNLIKTGFYRAGVIIWVKNHASFGWNDYKYKHEWILVGKRKEKRIKAVSIMYGWKKDSGHFFRDTRDEYDVWEVPRVHSADMMHPTQKPIWLISKALANSSVRGQNIVDLFGGVGSTLIACERLKRKCFTMEFDPKYIDVIVARWEKYTERKAVKVRAGSDNTKATTSKPQANRSIKVPV